MLLLIFLTFLAWVGGRFFDYVADDKQLLMGRNSSEKIRAMLRRYALLVLIVINMSILFWYKYINLIIETYWGWFGDPALSGSGWVRVALPIGLSFIILQATSYLVDVYRRDCSAQPSFIAFATYISMFNQLIAGPILRYVWVQHELVAHRIGWEYFAAGARRFMIGVSMKVLIADSLSPLVETAFALQNPSFVDAWLACVAYTLQLFFDFAGYSAMAVGLGQMQGFRIPENFNHPYLSVSIRDFWRRWHISLSTWIRDYLYIPLGGSRHGLARTCISLLLTMGIAGMWHGSDSWNFLLWGLAHGFALVAAHLWRFYKLPKIPNLLSRVVTLLFVCMAWVVFRATDFDAALNIYQGQFGANGWAMGDALRAAFQESFWIALALGVVCVVLPVFKGRFRSNVNQAVLTVIDFWPVLCFIVSIGLIASRKAVPFLYFQF